MVYPSETMFPAELTAAVPPIRVQGVVGSATALGTGGRGQAQMGTVAVVERAAIGAVLAGGVEHQDVQHQLQLTLRTQSLTIIQS